MPPLVDNPIPLPPLTFMFADDLPPLLCAPPEPAMPDLVDEPAVVPETLETPAGRGSHAKKRDASYIPRPPNAFILFRSHFIRAQHIPGQIEGSHSALSKIIGASPSSARAIPLLSFPLSCPPPIFPR